MTCLAATTSQQMVYSLLLETFDERKHKVNVVQIYFNEGLFHSNNFYLNSKLREHIVLLSQPSLQIFPPPPQILVLHYPNKSVLHLNSTQLRYFKKLFFDNYIPYKQNFSESKIQRFILKIGYQILERCNSSDF